MFLTTDYWLTGVFLNFLARISHIVLLISFLVVSAQSKAQDCQTGHWIQDVSGNGKIIKLEDGSLWEVSSVDVVTSALWLPLSEIAICGNTLINTDDRESVTATRASSANNRSSGTRHAREVGYVIEAAVNDEVFVINGEFYEAKTYCFGFDKGDRVKFIDGSSLGACVSAEILHLNSGKTCRLWCE